MGRKAGVTLIELFTLTDQINQVLPTEIADFFRRFVAIDLETRTSSRAIIYTGKLQSMAETLDSKNIEKFKFSFGTLQIPLLSTGVPFQLSLIRAEENNENNIEGGAQSWQFDILLNDLTLILNDLVAADYVAESSTIPRHLIPKEGDNPTAITGSAGVRFERSNENQPIVVRLFDPTSGSDPFIPMEQSGMVFNVTCTPPHFLIGKSQFGMTVRSLMFDYSRTYSPPEILERGQSPDWVGLAIKEATLYLPPNALGGSQFSAGLENFLIGDPFGLQGELEVQFGQSPLLASTFIFKQGGIELTTGFNQEKGTLEIQSLPDEEVSLTASISLGSPPSGSNITDWEAEFHFPNQAPIIADSATGLVKHGSKLTITPIEVIGTGEDKRKIKKPPFTIRMIASGSAPKISLLINGVTFDNLLELSGPKEKLEVLEIKASAIPTNNNAHFSWVCEKLALNHQGSSLTFNIPSNLFGKQNIKITEVDENKATTHIRVNIRDDANDELYIGCEAGVFAQSDLSTPVEIAKILGTYDLESFHEKGELEGVDAQATAIGSDINIPDGTLAEVSINEGAVEAEYKENRHIQILFNFDEYHAVIWGEKQPWGSAGSDIGQDLQDWAECFPNAKFQIIGRCDDIGSDTYNVNLAQRRANNIKDLLNPILNEDDIQAVGEQSISTLLEGATDLIVPDIEEENGRLINKNGTSKEFPKNSSNTYGIRQTPIDANIEKIRKQYRRADIYAIGGNVKEPEKEETSNALAPTHRRLLVPSSNRQVFASNNEATKADYRVKLNLGWDKPRFKGWSDIIPNLAEFEYAWTPSEDDGISTSSEVLTIYGGYIFDELTGFTDVTLGLKSEGDPDGLAKTEQANLVAALAFGPMLSSGVDFDNDVFGSAVRLGALGALSGFASVDLGSGKKLISEGSNSILIAIEAHAATRTIHDPLERFKIQLMVDYSNTLHINGGVLGLRTDSYQPMKLRYSKVGVEFDNSNSNTNLINKIGFAYNSDSMTIEDSGLWKIEGALGKLLRVSEFKMGVGSFWIEPTFAFALDIGVVEISEASFRLTFDENNIHSRPKFTLRGLKAKIDIPNTIKGEGRLRIEDGGVIKAALDMVITPLKVYASAALSVGSPPKIAPAIFFNLFSKVQFPGGIPIGPLPIAIHGFIGQTVINGHRDINEVSNVVTREIDWWKKDPENKYEPIKSQHALGLGVVMGTLPDASFSFSLTGMVVVAFPDPEVILGAEINLLSIPDTTAKDKKDGNTANITGLVVINSDAVIVAVSASYEIPKILKLKVPFGAYFPAPSSNKNVYIRLGSDGVNGRDGEPITITFLPDTLNVKAWAYLMIEGGGIQDLGGERDWDFNGFAIGFGAGHALNWGAGRIGLSASAKILVGVGTDPLIIKGGLFVKGKLDLVVISVSVKGDIVLTYMQLKNNSIISLDGKFCGEVDMFFFSLKGCVAFTVGSASNFTPEEPPAPVKSISLTDRMNTIMGEATIGQIQANPLFDFKKKSDGTVVNKGVEPKNNHVVWADTIPVLNFAHYIQDNLPSTEQFNPKSQPAGEVWFGSSRLKYAYRLDHIRLVRLSDGAIVSDPSGEKLLSAWMHTPHRPSDNSSGSGSNIPSGAEVTKLQLLTWEPWAWAKGTSEGGEGQPGDPADMIERLCESMPQPQPACLLGQDIHILSMSRSALRRPHPSQGAYPSKFKGIGETFFPLNRDEEIKGSTLRSFLSTAGITMTAGQIVPTIDFSIGSDQITKGYRLPGVELYYHNRIRKMTLPWRVELDCDVQQGEFFLLVCEDGKQENEGKCYMFEDIKRNMKEKEFKLKLFSISSINPNYYLETIDAIDTIKKGHPHLGQDKQIDMLIPKEGASIKFKEPYQKLTLHFYAYHKGIIVFTLFHSNGKKTEETLNIENSGATSMHLNSTSTIESIDIHTNNKISLYKVCFIEKHTCVDFSKLQLPERTSKFVYKELVFMDVDGNFSLRRVDQVTERYSNLRRGHDGKGELEFGKAGLRVTLPSSSTELELLLFIYNTSWYEIIAFNKHGEKEARKKGTCRQGALKIHLWGDDISYFIVKIGAQALLINVCFDKREQKIEEEKKLTIPVVNSVDKNSSNKKERWNGESISTYTNQDGSRCRLIRYQSPYKTMLFNQLSVDLFSVMNATITMIRLCAVDERSAQWYQSDKAVRDELRNNLSDSNNSIDNTRPIILEPDTSYKIEVEWSWQAWQGKSNHDNAPTNPSSTWQTGTPQHFKFKTASEDNTLPARQDGNNEYIFDPRDLDRYLLESEPSNGAIAHFTDDPVVFHFSQQHIVNLLKQYNRELDIEICRTDPPPQSGGDFSSMVKPLSGELQLLHAPIAYHTPVDARILQAIEGLPCIPNHNPSKLGGATLAGTFELLPNVMYDANLVVQKINNKEDKVLVHALNFRTSRYANPKEMIEAMGCSTDATISSMPPLELIVGADANVPTDSIPASDKAFAMAMKNMGLDTLPLPSDRAKIFQIWKVHTDGVEMVALLLDVLEPLNRVTSVISSDGHHVEIVNRSHFEGAEIDNIPFKIIRMTRNTTRVLLVPTSTFTAPTDQNSLKLIFSTNEGEIIGRKFLRSTPLTIELEGF